MYAHGLVYIRGQIVQRVFQPAGDVKWLFVRVAAAAAAAAAAPPRGSLVLTALQLQRTVLRVQREAAEVHGAQSSDRDPRRQRRQPSADTGSQEPNADRTIVPRARPPGTNSRL